MNKNTAILNWSGGKDSALALYKILQLNKLRIKYLVTSVSEEFNRISMHGVRTELLIKQTHSIGIPLREIKLPEKADIEIYNRVMEDCMTYFVNDGISTSIFGDIFLEDLRIYREKQLEKIGMKASFPLWKIDTKELAEEFIQLGFKTIITCVDAQKLDKSFVGRLYNKEFLADLPSTVDPCGENGEFHTFVFDGPIFSHPITFTKGGKVYKTYSKQTRDSESESGFWYIDLISN